MAQELPSPQVKLDLKPEKGTTIVLTHGAIVSPIRAWEMALLAWRLRGLGYQVKTFCYPSMLGRLSYNATNFRSYLQRISGETVHIVAHSMGGVLTREVLEGGLQLPPGRVVALGSPFLDCWIGKRFNRFLGRWAIGETVYEHIGRTLEPVWGGGRELGVLAGTFPFGVGRNFPSMPKPNDGVIIWDETRLTGMTDHATLPVNHAGLLLSYLAFQHIAHFLKFGHFVRRAPVVREKGVLCGCLAYRPTEPIAMPAVFQSHSGDEVCEAEVDPQS